jgi:hypothetical protein
VQNKKKLLYGYAMLLSALLLTIGIRILAIRHGFQIAKEFGYEKHLNYSRERSIVIWGAIPYLIMGIELLWQYVRIRKKRIISIDIGPLMIVSSIGLVLYFFNNTNKDDVWARPLYNLAIPALQLIAYLFARIKYDLKNAGIR